MLQAEHRDQRLCDPRSTERVSGPALCRTAGSRAPEDAGDGLVFHGVVDSGRRAMQIDIVDIPGLQTGAPERIPNRPDAPAPSGWGWDMW